MLELKITQTRHPRSVVDPLLDLHFTKNKVSEGNGKCSRIMLLKDINRNKNSHLIRLYKPILGIECQNYNNMQAL